MSEIVVAIFSTEGQAHEAAQQLSSTAAQEGIVIHGAAHAVGFASGGLIGAVKEMSDEAGAEARLRDLHTRLTPGRSALVVDLDERSLQKFSARIQGLGGEVVAPGLQGQSHG